MITTEKPNFHRDAFDTHYVPNAENIWYYFVKQFGLNIEQSDYASPWAGNSMAILYEEGVNSETGDIDLRSMFDEIRYNSRIVSDKHADLVSDERVMAAVVASAEVAFDWGVRGLERPELDREAA